MKKSARNDSIRSAFFVSLSLFAMIALVEISGVTETVAQSMPMYGSMPWYSPTLPYDYSYSSYPYPRTYLEYYIRTPYPYSFPQGYNKPVQTIRSSWMSGYPPVRHVRTRYR